MRKDCRCSCALENIPITCALAVFFFFLLLQEESKKWYHGTGAGKDVCCEELERSSV